MEDKLRAIGDELRRKPSHARLPHSCSPPPAIVIVDYETGKGSNHK